jgi:hypothetical protein
MGVITEGYIRDTISVKGFEKRDYLGTLDVDAELSCCGKSFVGPGNPGV